MEILSFAVIPNAGTEESNFFTARFAKIQWRSETFEIDTTTA
jgi:hypothetical protein